ncbi:MAG: MFS transporter [Bacteroidetes bacterium]|nr:MFS transporter [Bacteroidota bacterium]
MIPLIKEYRNIEQNVLNVIFSEFFIQIVNVTFMNILPLYMSREGFSDEDIALFITFRFLGVFILAVPFGKKIKKRKLMPLFLISNIFVPMFGILIVLGVAYKLKVVLIISLLCWGAAFTFMQIPISPFILRNCALKNQTSAISLSYSTWGFGGILSGLIIFLLDLFNDKIFNEKNILILFSLLGLLGLFFIFKNKKFEEKILAVDFLETKYETPKNNWNIILKALIPTLIIAVGAGLTIPFLSLFFEKVHELNKGQFSVLSSIAALLVAYAAMLVPTIKKKYGYQKAIPTTQSIAVVSLAVLASTQYYNQYSFAVIIAAIFYLLRQPLMNMAGPMTTELVLNYVGSNNQEITSALTSAIWSGSWVFSGLMVKLLLSYKVHFANIFLITSALYAFGVMMYYFLILDYNKREKIINETL